MTSRSIACGDPVSSRCRHTRQPARWRTRWLSSWNIGVLPATLSSISVDKPGSSLGTIRTLGGVSQLVAGLTDVVFGSVMVGCALASSRLDIPRITHRYWPATFWFGALSAYIGVLHHLAFAGHRREADASWAFVGIALCLAMSAMLAATATEVLAPRTSRSILLVRAMSLIAYAIFAVSGHGNLSYLLGAESI